jgi:NADP-reducing hydrogenase subunit HndD
MEQMIPLTIDGVHVEVPAGTTVLEASRKAGVKIPTLCYLKDINQSGSCRMCVVDVGARAFQAACVLPVTKDMVVKTNSPALREARRTVLELILSNHDKKCLTCVRSQNCELQKLCLELGVEDGERYAGARNEYAIDDASPSIVRDNNKCILCRRCVAACEKVQQIGVIGPTNRGFKTAIASPWGMHLSEMACVNCGQCITVCPVGALHEKDETDLVWQALSDPDKHVVVQTAPAVRAALGEEFGIPMGTSVTGKMAAALRRMGFDKVFDTDFAADLPIMEEGTSPHEMEGAMIKSYYAEMAGIDPKDIVVVSVMPCTAKKFEAKRPELSHGGNPDVDVVITTRELARMIKECNINFNKLPDEDFDSLLGESTGASVIFGATGGVMEAALRTAYTIITGEELEDVNFTAVRGVEGIKEATVKIGDMDVSIAVASSTGMAAKLLDAVKSGEKKYAFIEIMGCPGGCVNGGGQPIVDSATRSEVDIRTERAKALYNEDAAKTYRKSHQNPMIKKIYDEYLEKPNSHKAHELLHTTYVKRPKYSK